MLDLYGPLLTERQLQFIRLHYEEDLSFGEIAKEYQVSRQAVHDAVKHAEQALEEYDAKLKLAPEAAQSRRAAREAGVPGDGQAPAGDGGGAAPRAAALTSAALAPVFASLEALEQKLRKSGVIYNPQGLAKEVKEIHESLRRLASEGQET